MILRLSVLLLVTCSFCAVGQVLVDPTRPSAAVNSERMQNPAEANAADSRVKVTAVFVRGEMKRAVINGKSYAKGETVLGAKIMSIEPHRIVLRDDDGDREFFINNNNVKKDATNGF